MASTNPFDLLGDDDNDDPSQLIASQLQKVTVTKKPQAPNTTTAATKQAKLPTKPVPPTQAVRDAKSEGRGGSRGGRGYGGRGGGRGGGGGFRQESGYNNASGGYGTVEDGDTNKQSERRGGYGGPRGSFRGGRRGGFSNGEAGDEERPKRVYERRSGTGRGSDVKREGAGRGNWGTSTDEIAQDTENTNESEKNISAEKLPGEEDKMNANNENANESEVKEPEDKEMTLEEYEKVLEEKRKALQALKAEERKVDLDKDLASMQLLSNKKQNDEIFVKLGSDKDKRKEITDKEERAKKSSLSINEFLKPGEGEKYYSPGGRGRGRGRGTRGGFGGGNTTNNSNTLAPSIEDPGQFPTLGCK